MTERLPSRAALSTLVSAVLHTASLVVLATTSVRLASLEDRDVIPLVIRNPAPPPPPPGAGSSAAPAAVVSEPPKPAEPVQPAPVQPVARKPAERPRIAAQPKPKAQVAPKPEPAAEPAIAAPPPAAAVPQSGETAGAVGGGVLGGVRGGEVGGRIGGRLGGTGDDIWSADQVAVPPKPIQRVLPSYPPIARARGQEAVVVVQAVIDRSGVVEAGGVKVVESHPPFDDAAMEAFRRWTFEPGRDEHGQLVRVRVQQPIRFSLR